MQRDRNLATDETLEAPKTFIADRCVKTAGRVGLYDGSVGSQFQPFCYDAGFAAEKQH